MLPLRIDLANEIDSLDACGYFWINDSNSISLLYKSLLFKKSFVSLFISIIFPKLKPFLLS